MMQAPVQITVMITIGKKYLFQRWTPAAVDLKTTGRYL